MDLFLFDPQATGRCRFRLCPIRCSPFLAGLSPILPGAAVSADVGFILIAISAERVVIITVRWRIPHRPHFDTPNARRDSLPLTVGVILHAPQAGSTLGRSRRRLDLRELFHANNALRPGAYPVRMRGYYQAAADIV